MSVGLGDSLEDNSLSTAPGPWPIERSVGLESKSSTKSGWKGFQSHIGDID